MSEFSTHMLARTASRFAILGAVGALALGLSSCLGSDEKSGGTPRIEYSMTAEILLNTPPQNGQPGTLVVRSTEYSCEDDGEQFVAKIAPFVLCQPRTLH